MKLEDYTQQIVPEDGTYRAFPVAWSFQTNEKTGSGSIVYRLAIHSKWIAEAKEWSPQWPVGYYVDNYTCVVKRGGTELNDGFVRGLVECGLWDGDFDAIQGAPPSVMVIADVTSREWEGRTRMQAEYLSPNAEAPKLRGNLKPADASNLAAMRARFGPALKAVAGVVAGQTPATPTPGGMPQATMSPAVAAHATTPAAVSFPAAVSVPAAEAGTGRAPEFHRTLLHDPEENVDPSEIQTPF